MYSISFFDPEPNLSQPSAVRSGRFFSSEACLRVFSAQLRALRRRDSSNDPVAAFRDVLSLAFVQLQYVCVLCADTCSPGGSGFLESN